MFKSGYRSADALCEMQYTHRPTGQKSSMAVSSPIIYTADSGELANKIHLEIGISDLDSPYKFAAMQRQALILFLNIHNSFLYTNPIIRGAGGADLCIPVCCLTSMWLEAKWKKITCIPSTCLSRDQNTKSGSSGFRVLGCIWLCPR